MSNKKTGSTFERQMANWFGSHGFWVTLLNQGISGQPADLLVIDKISPILVECKHCSKDRFVLSRIEPNQWKAAEKFEQLTYGASVVCVGFPKGVLIINTKELEKVYKRGINSLTYDDMKDKAGAFTLDDFDNMRTFLKCIHS